MFILLIMLMKFNQSVKMSPNPNHVNVMFMNRKGQSAFHIFATMLPTRFSVFKSEYVMGEHLYWIIHYLFT